MAIPELKSVLCEVSVQIENADDAKLIDADAIATAQTTVSYDAIGVEDIDTEKKTGLLKRLIIPGHLTPFENRNMIFRIQGFSRTGSTWIHQMARFYNTGQYSQRYLKLSKSDEMPHIFLPNAYFSLPDALLRKIYDFFSRRHQDYQKIMGIYGNELLKRGSVKDIEEGKKLTTQYARDIFPGAVNTAIRFSTNIIQLARLAIVSQNKDFDMPEDARIAILEMWRYAKECAPITCNAIEETFSNYSPPDILFMQDIASNPMAGGSYRDFYRMLEGKPVKIYKNEKGKSKLQKEISILGMPLPSKKINDMLDNINESFFGTSFGLQSVSSLGKAYNNLGSDGFYAVMSHSHLEQSVRHRMMNHNVNLVLPVFLDHPIYVLPPPFRGNAEIETVFKSAMDETWDLLDQLKGQELSPFAKSFLLPRGVAYLVSVSGSFGDLRHYLNLRACASAQFNIFESALTAIFQYLEIDSEGFSGFGPKCLVANTCVEGPRCCGLAPWIEKEGFDKVLNRRMEKGF